MIPEGSREVMGGIRGGGIIQNGSNARITNENQRSFSERIKAGGGALGCNPGLQTQIRMGKIFFSNQREERKTSQRAAGGEWARGQVEPHTGREKDPVRRELE